ncbi:hypothetical protein Tco_0493451 [Tanacetum coccineum]
MRKRKSNIPCSPECKIVRQILLDHPLSYALTATADVPTVYLQQFWRTVSKVPGPEETIKFMLNTQGFVYTVDMFRDILYLPVETLDNPFVAPANIETIEAFMNKVCYQGVVDKRLLIEEDYHCIKDDIPLIHATDDFKEYETVFMNVGVPMNQPQPIVSTQGTHRSTPSAYRTPTLTSIPQGKKKTQSAGESSSPRKSNKITIKRKKPSTTLIPLPSDDRERDEISEATLLSLTLHKTALAAKAQENIAKVQEKLAEEEIEKMVEGDEDEESYASEFDDSVLNDDVDDFGKRIEPESCKENPEKVYDDDKETETEKKDEEIEKDKKDEEIEKNKTDEEIEKENKDENAKKTDEVVTEKEIVDDVTGSMEIRKEQKQTPIPSLTRSPRDVSSSNKIVSEELTATVSPTPATTSKVLSTTKRKKRFISYKSKTLPGSIATMCRRHSLIHSHIKHKFVTHDFFMSNIREVLDHCNKVVPDVTFEKTKEMITQEMPRLVNLAGNKDREVDPINAKDMIAKEFVTHGPKMIKDLFRKHMHN